MKIIDRIAASFTFSRRLPMVAVFELENGYLIVKTGEDAVLPYWLEPGTSPEEVARRAKESGARQLLVMGCGDVSELNVSLKKDMDREEVAAVAARETAKLTGMAEDGLRVSCLRANSWGMAHGLLTQSFAGEDIRKWAAACRRHHIRFLGLTGVYPFLPVLAGDGRENGWLMMQQYSGAGGLFEQGKLQLRQLPFGLPGSKLTEEAWLARCRQRLGQLTGKRVIVLIPSPEHAAAVATLSRELPCETEVMLLEEAAPQLASAALKLQVDHQLDPALPPPRKRDPREIGTMICLITVGMTVFTLSVQYWQLRSSRDSLTQSLVRGTSNQKMLDAHESELKRLGEEIEKYRFQAQALTVRQPMAESFTTVLELLAKQPLRYTRLEMLREEKNGIVIAGESVAQIEVTGFLERLAAALHEHKLHLVSEQLGHDLYGVIKFRLRIKSDVRLQGNRS